MSPTCFGKLPSTNFFEEVLRKGVMTQGETGWPSVGNFECVVISRTVRTIIGELRRSFTTFDLTLKSLNCQAIFQTFLVLALIAVILMSALDYKLLLRQEREAALKKLVAESDSRAEHSSAESTKEVTHTATKSAEDAKDCPCMRKYGAWKLNNIKLEQIGEIPSIFYAKDVVNEECESQLIQCTQAVGTLQKAWRQLKARRLQCWGSFPDVSSEITLSAPIPPWLESLIDAVMQQAAFEGSVRPNNVLINQYNADEGILHHTDGPAYHDRVAIISLGSDTILSFRKKLSSDQIGTEFAGDVCSVLLRRRSMLVFEGDAYNHYMHGIECGQAEQQVGAQGPCINAHLADLDPATDTHHVRDAQYFAFIKPDAYTDVPIVSCAQIVRTVRTSITFRRLNSS